MSKPKRRQAWDEWDDEPPAPQRPRLPAAMEDEFSCKEAMRLHLEDLAREKGVLRPWVEQPRQTSASK